MTQEMLYAAVGAVFSLAFERLPFIKDWFEKQAPIYKQLIQLGVMALVVLAAYGLSCAGLFNYWPCNMQGFWDAVGLYLAALIGNQVFHMATKSVSKKELDIARGKA